MNSSWPSNFAVGAYGFSVIWGLEAVVFYYAFKGLCRGKNRACLYWALGIAIKLVCEMGIKWHILAGSHRGLAQFHSIWFWNPSPDFALRARHAETLLRFHWLGQSAASALITTGLILLLRQLRSENPPSPSPPASKYGDMRILLPLTVFYFGLVFCGFAEWVPVVTPVVMLGWLLPSLRRSNKHCVALWALACTVPLLWVAAIQWYRTFFDLPGIFDRFSLELTVAGGSLAGLFWVAGLWLALRQLMPPKVPAKPKAKTFPWWTQLPQSPGTMKQRLATIICIWGLAMVGVWLYNNDPSQVFSLEPKYEGYTLGYWMDHWYQSPWGGTVNNEAKEAVQTMGARAVPYLVDWIARPMNSYPSPGGDYAYRALQAFAVLGPVAKPAVPKLVKMLGRNSNFAQQALVYIGPDAALPLGDKLLEILADTNPPSMNWHQRPFYVQQRVLETLGQMGTNAGAAVPALIKAFAGKNLRNRADTAMVLANVGRNQPDTVIPVLLNAFTNADLDPSAQGAIADAVGVIGDTRPDTVIPVLINVITNASTDPRNQAAIAGALAAAGRDRPSLVVPVLIGVLTNINTHTIQSGNIIRQRFQDGFRFPVADGSVAGARGEIADALAEFGKDARVAIPVLCLAGTDANADLRAHAALAIQRIGPETPAALAPLIRNLTDPKKQVRQQALEMLNGLGTNAAPALSVLVWQSVHDPDPRLREIAVDCLANLGQMNAEVISALGKNAVNPDEQLALRTTETLSNFAGQSKQALLELAKVMSASPVISARQTARTSLQARVENDPGVLGECLSDTNSQTRYQALRLVDRFGVHLPQTIPALKQALHDENPAARDLATNMLIQIESETYGRQVAEILVRGDHLNATNEQGQTILHRQILSPSPDQMAAVIALLDAGANPNAKDNQSRTPVHLLLTGPWPWQGAGELLALLANRGADLATADNQGKTPLHYLAALGRQQPLFFLRGVADIFISAKVDLSPRDRDGDTPLHIAARTGTKDVFDWLVKNGASLDATNNLGETPRLLATRSREMDFHFGPGAVETDIFEAIRAGKSDSVRRLLSADPQLANEPDQFGRTPMRLAIQMQRADLISLLKTVGAK